MPESDAKYRAIFDLANDAIFLHDPATGAILDVNDKMSEMYGYTRDEAVRLTVADLSASNGPATQTQALDVLHAAASGLPQLFEWHARDRSGRRFWVEVNLKQVDIAGEVQLLAIVRDITERKRTEREIHDSHESQKLLNALLRLALEDLRLDELLHKALALVLHNPWPATRGAGAVFLYDEDWRLALEAHIGLDAASFDAERASRATECACGPGFYCLPIAAGGTRLGVLKVYLEEEHSLSASEVDFLGAFATTLAGIIIRKRAEQSFAMAADQLREQEALVRLGEMAAVVAHEVKNPLAGIRGTIQIIGRRLPAESKEASVITDVINRLDALDDLMKDLLLFARPPAPKFAQVDIVALARETAELVANDPSARDVRFEVEGATPAVMADPKLLKCVLLNVLLNAAHAQRAGVVRTSVISTSGVCLVTVTDTGPGIPPEIRDKIFVPFFTTKARGTGLGLPTAKRLVDAHNGRIFVECPGGGGTSVTVELPR